MDTELLVDHGIEDGRELLVGLVAAGFDVSVAFWGMTAEERLWHLYIGSTSVEPARVGDAYRTLYVCLSKLSGQSIELSEVMLVEAGNTLAQDIMKIRDKQMSRTPLWRNKPQFVSLSVEQVYIYPRLGPLTTQETLQMLSGIMNRPTGELDQQSVLTLKDGTRIEAVITGFRWKTITGLTIDARDLQSGLETHFAGDDVLNVQPRLIRSLATRNHPQLSG